MNTQTSIIFLYASNKQSEIEIFLKIPFTIASKYIKYLRVSLIKDVQNLYLETIKHCGENFEKTSINTKIVFTDHKLNSVMMSILQIGLQNQYNSN